MLTDPAAHGIDLERTAVLYMATGSEWPETRLLVDIGKSGYWDLRNAFRPVRIGTAGSDNGPMLVPVR